MLVPVIVCSAHATGPACGGRHILTSPCSVCACDRVWLGWRFPLVEVGLTDHPQMLTSSGISTLLSHLYKLWGTGWRMDLTKHQLGSKPKQIKLSSSILFQVPARLFPDQHFCNISKEKAPATQYTRGLPVFTEIWDVKSYAMTKLSMNKDFLVRATKHDFFLSIAFPIFKGWNLLNVMICGYY